ncbi:mitochondrial 37S ribosomal protein RSM26 [Sugiyamaella lignohabitans]|uniref:Mitochondrial 37S ribosomal protein RSM26 n=1 Tax=Sugiyamaella lignohabitans TaxID=796027 RepID=A0A167DUT9_9ASCO|nr:mitochondrial 37S ribosomal protein RSM26 [Sugiyamaella lignohabitans]ANB13315.1 mitochondrial 37S ribosomal protein RSM26 [Sugiyamaella lignohabitans]
MFARSTIRACNKATISRPVTRLIHSVPKLKNQNHYEQVGIPGLYSAEGFKTAWNDHQSHLLTKLNNLTVDTDNEARIPLHILLNTATKSDQAHIFNNASQAHNNHLFFQALTSPETNQTKPSALLQSRINKSFGSLEELREQFLLAADLLLGNGWVFLIEGPDKSLGIMSCYNAGTPYHIARAQLFDLNRIIDSEVHQSIEAISGAVRSKEKNFNIALLAANVWEHAYLTDYSVSGKTEYLEKWWASIDWDVVSSRLYSGN